MHKIGDAMGPESSNCNDSMDTRYPFFPHSTTCAFPVLLRQVHLPRGCRAGNINPKDVGLDLQSFIMVRLFHGSCDLLRNFRYKCCVPYVCLLRCINLLQSLGKDASYFLFDLQHVRQPGQLSPWSGNFVPRFNCLV